MNDLAGKLDVPVQDSDIELAPEDLTTTLIARAKQAGKSEAEINAAFAEE